MTANVNIAARIQDHRLGKNDLYWSALSGSACKVADDWFVHVPFRWAGFWRVHL